MGRSALIRSEHLFPETLDIGAQLSQSCWIEAVDALLALPPHLHQARRAQDPQVLRDGGLADGDRLDQVADRAGAQAEPLQQLAAGRVTECFDGRYISHNLYDYKLIYLCCQAQLPPPPR